MRSSSLLFPCVLLAAAVLACSLTSALPSPATFAELAEFPRLIALSTSRAHHPTLLPTSLPSPSSPSSPSSPYTTRWWAPATTRSTVPSAPCPIDRPWNVSLPLLLPYTPLVYTDCQLLALLTCDSPDDCPSNLTAISYRTGAPLYTLPYSNSSNDLPQGGLPLLLSTSSSHLYLHRTVDPPTPPPTTLTCNALDAYARQGTKVAPAWTQRLCVDSTHPIELFTAQVVPVSGRDVLLWWAVTTDDAGEYLTHYAAYNAATGAPLSNTTTLTGGIVDFELKDDAGLLLTSYIYNRTQLTNTTTLDASTGALTVVTPFALPPNCILLPGMGPAAMLFNFTSAWGVDVRTNQRLYTVSADDEILFPPFVWLLDGFSPVYTSFSTYESDPSSVIIVSNAQNTDTNQLIAIAGVYDTLTGRRTMTSKVLGPVTADGNVIDLQFVSYTDDGLVPIIPVAHHFYAVDPRTLAVVAQGEKPFGELTTYTEFVSQIDRATYSTITLERVDQYLFNFVGLTVKASTNQSQPAAVEQDGKREVRVASE